MRTKLLNNLNIVVGFGAHGAPYDYFYRVVKGSLKAINGNKFWAVVQFMI